jgi:hypothetical protein
LRQEEEKKQGEKKWEKKGKTFVGGLTTSSIEKEKEKEKERKK